MRFSSPLHPSGTRPALGRGVNSVAVQVFDSSFETEVLFLFLDGLTYRQIATEAGRTEKAVDNAVQRIRRKLARQKPFQGDISRS